MVELLVVASIMAALFGLVLAGIRPSLGGEVRRAAQQFASVLLATQSRAIGGTDGGAVVLESQGTQSISVYAGERPPAVIGAVNGGMPPENPAASMAAVAITVSNGGNLQQGFRVQFYGDTPTMPPSAWFGFEFPGTVRYRMDDGQTPANTVWPSPTEAPLRARVLCFPLRGALAMEFPNSTGIDLRYSGTGDDPATEWGGLANKGDLGVTFDTTGVVDALMQGIGGDSTKPAKGRQPVEPVYFLIATRADIGDDRSLANDRSMWVVIQPQTGRVTVSTNVGQTGKDREAVRAARANARAALAAGK